MSYSMNMDFGSFPWHNFDGGKSVRFRHPVPHLYPLGVNKEYKSEKVY